MVAYAAPGQGLRDDFLAILHHFRGMLHRLRLPPGDLLALDLRQASIDAVRPTPHPCRSIDAVGRGLREGRRLRLRPRAAVPGRATRST